MARKRNSGEVSKQTYDTPDCIVAAVLYIPATDD